MSTDDLADWVRRLDDPAELASTHRRTVRTLASVQVLRHWPRRGLGMSAALALWAFTTWRSGSRQQVATAPA